MSFVSCVLMIGMGDALDEDLGRRPLNKLPARCSFCSFPDLNCIPAPYILKKKAVAPTEIAVARVGNFLVRDRLRRIMEAAVPGACTFHPTAVQKADPQDWWLAVPRNQRTTGIPPAEPPFCPQCGEPKVWSVAMGPVWSAMKQHDTGGIDVFKSAEWCAGGNAEADYEATNKFRAEQGLPPLGWKEWGVPPPEHPGRWTRVGLNRDLYFSARFDLLLQKASRKRNLVRYGGITYSPPSPGDNRWVSEKLALLRDRGLIDDPAKAAGPEKRKSDNWFQTFLSKHQKDTSAKASFAAIEKAHGIKLPVGFTKLVRQCGALTFRNVDGNSGLTVHLLQPDKMDFKNYRRGKIPHLDEEQTQIDGVMFATANNGDVFIFDVAVTGAEYPVYRYQHEENRLELFAQTFPECIQRLAGKSA